MEPEQVKLANFPKLTDDQIIRAIIATLSFGKRTHAELYDAVMESLFLQYQLYPRLTCFNEIVTKLLETEQIDVLTVTEHYYQKK